MFSLDPSSKQIEVVHADALDYVLNHKNHHQFDSLQVDIFNGDASGPAINSLEFYQGCFHVLKEPGVMTVNLFSRHESFSKNINHICDAFNDRVLLFKEVHDCNVVAIAFKGPPLQVTWKKLQERAEYIKKEWKLPSKNWVKQLRQSNVQLKEKLVI
jgi:spermidine synthase